MRRITNGLFILLILEIAIGGGGRLTAFGPVSLRMILFGLAVIVSVVYIIQGKKIDPENKRVLMLWMLMLAVALAIGISGGASRQYWWEDLKPLLYIFVVPFFQFALEDKRLIGSAVSIIKVAAIIQAAAFLIVLVLIHTGVVPFLTFYHAVLPTEEFFFRGEMSFFYKGFLYICIAFILIHLTGEKNRTLWLTFLVVAIALSFTRGFWFALALTYAVYYFTKSKKFKLLAFSILAAGILFFGKSLIGFTGEVIDSIRYRSTSAVSERRLGDRDVSDAARKKQVEEVISMMTPRSFFIGHGFGIGTPSRPVHMEISYLEIFHKQGVLGLFFWGYFFFLILRNYLSASTVSMSAALFFSVLFIFLESLTNQYINNPIGLCFILFALVAFKRLKK